MALRALLGGQDLLDTTPGLRIRRPLQRSPEDGLREAPVHLDGPRCRLSHIERVVIEMLDQAQDLTLHLRRDDLEASDKDPNDLGRRRIDREGQDLIRGRPRHQIEAT